ncbi:MAG: DUF4912 domain-containing protein [Myxococcota bacterium]
MGQRRHSGRSQRRKTQNKGDRRKAEPSPWATPVEGDRVWMMPCNADHALVYWELTGASIAQARANLERISPDVQLVLRVRCSGHSTPAGPGARTYDIPIASWVGQRHILLGPSGCAHFCAVGFRTLNTTEGVFAAIARSQVVVSPRHA